MVGTMVMTVDRVMGVTHLDRDGVGCLRIVGIYKTPSNRCRTGNDNDCVKEMYNRSRTPVPLPLYIKTDDPRVSDGLPRENHRHLIQTVYDGIDTRATTP